jgi:hypothetical protein
MFVLVLLDGTNGGLFFHIWMGFFLDFGFFGYFGLFGHGSFWNGGISSMSS